MSKKAAPTVRDVARAAKVSPSTVSRVLHGGRHVRTELAQRVSKAARRLGYRLNPFVSELMTRRRSTAAGPGVAPVFAWVEPFADAEETMAHSVQRRFLAGALERAEEMGCRIERFQARAAGMSAERLTEVLAARGIEGVILLPQPRHLEPGVPLDVRRFACVSLGRASDARRLHTVASHVADVMMTACRALHARGRRRIGCMLPHFVDRLMDFQFAAGYFAAVAADLRASTLPILYGYGLEGGAGAGADHALARDARDRDSLRLWLKEARPDAVVSTHREARDALCSLGLRVPEDLAFAHLCLEPEERGGELAGVDQNLEKVAAAAVDVLIAQLTRNERGVPVNPRMVLVPGRWWDGKSA